VRSFNSLSLRDFVAILKFFPFEISPSKFLSGFDTAPKSEYPGKIN